MAVKKTRINGKNYSLYPMTGTEALGYAYDVGTYLLPSLSALVPKIVSTVMKKEGEVNTKSLLDDPDFLKALENIDFESSVSGFFRNCSKDKFLELWETTKPFIKEGDAKEINWEITFQGDAFSQIKLMGAYINAYITPFFSDLKNTEKTSHPKGKMKIS